MSEADSVCGNRKRWELWQTREHTFYLNALPPAPQLHPVIAVWNCESGIVIVPIFLYK